MRKFKKINDYRNDVLKFVIGGISIFVFGMFVGYQLDNSALSSIQGYLFNAVGEATDANATNSNATNSNATNSNATNSNATNSNATNSNATNSNATNSNATNSNAALTDNIMELNSFSLNSKSVIVGNRVSVNISTTGACNTGVSLVFKNKNNGLTFTVSINSINQNPYIVVPKNVSAGTYSITEMMLVGTNSDNSTFTKKYINDPLFSKISLEVKTNEKVNNNQTQQSKPKLSLDKLTLKSSEANVGDNVYIDLKTSISISSLKLTFKSKNDTSMVVYAKSLTNNPYFVVPSTTNIGSYSLISAVLKSDNETIIYSKDGSISGSKKFAFNSNIVINDVKQQDVLSYNNEEINDTIISDLNKSKNTATINVSADTNPLINAKLFDSIKGTNRTLIINYADNQVTFKGKDVVSSKDIDVSMTTSIISKDSDIGKLVDNGILLDLASNGNLPGIAIFKIKITDEMKNILNNEKIYIYRYNENTNDFTEVALNVEATNDGYYEFSMDHNSEYILINEELDEDLICKTQDNIVSFQKSDKANLLLIILGGLLAVIVIVIVLIAKKKRV